MMEATQEAKMSKKKKAGKPEAKVKSSKTARRPGASELSETQLDQVAGGAQSLAGLQGVDTSKDGHKDEIEVLSWSFGVQSPPGGLKSR